MSVTDHKKKRMKNITFTLPDSDIEALKKLADMHELKLSELARAVVAAGIKEIEKSG